VLSSHRARVAGFILGRVMPPPPRTTRQMWLTAVHGDIALVATDRTSTDNERRGWDSNPRTRLHPVSGFQDRCVRPLRHPAGQPRIVVPKRPSAETALRSPECPDDDQSEDGGGGLYSSCTAAAMSTPPASTGSMYKRPSVTRPSRITKIVTPRMAKREPSTW
jgi:hypothetical protein